MSNSLLLAWRNPHTSDWVPVGKLCFRKNKYIFKYTVGARKPLDAGFFTPFAGMDDITKHYESETLFPLFQNRLLPKTRPEYHDYLEWLNLEENNFSPLDELARTGGIRVTDNLQLFPVPDEKNGKYEVTFFSHGISHLPACYIKRVEHLNSESKLYLMKDVQNEYDPFALALRTEDPPELVGYVPRFFSSDFYKLIDSNSPANVYVAVVKINLNSPVQFRLLCKLTTKWPDRFVAFSDDDFSTL